MAMSDLRKVDTCHRGRHTYQSDPAGRLGSLLVFAMISVHTSAKLNNVRAHVGAEVSVSDLGSRLTPPAWLPHQHPDEPVHLPLLCASREGYQNLCQLITKFKMRETTKADGAASSNELGQQAKGLICLTGGDEGPLAAALMQGGDEAGRRRVEELIAIFGCENVYVELQRHREREEEWHCPFGSWAPPNRPTHLPGLFHSRAVSPIQNP